MDNKRITADELAEKLVGSRKIMNKVDSGNYEKGNINEEMLRSDPEDLMKIETPTSSRASKPVGDINIDKINSSKLPDAIKKAMAENPIPQISLNEGLSMSFAQKAKKLMEQDGVGTKSTQPISKQPTNNGGGSQQININELEKRLTTIIENTISKKLEEIVDRKLNLILSAQQSSTINENLAIRVGDSIFTGKITKVKSTK